VQIINARLRAIGKGSKPVFDKAPRGTQDAVPALIGKGYIWFKERQPALARYYDRELLQVGNLIYGPAVVFQLDTTTLIPPEWQACIDDRENLILTK
jgi:N-methylhydantoinase A